MPADYKPRDDLKKKPALPGYVWLLSGLTIGLFVALLIYLDKQPASPVAFQDAVKAELESIKHEKRKTPLETAPATESTPPPKYNFYTILQGMKVLIPESETRLPEAASGGDDKPRRYILQAGSFQNLRDAEKLKAKLAFLGIETDIQHVTVNRQQWHRVRSGPYDDMQQLLGHMKTMQRHHITAISMEFRPAAAE